MVALIMCGITLVGSAAADTGRVELVKMRGEFTKVFKNSDGTVTRQYWINPIHYCDENNQWAEIDRSIMDFAKDTKVKASFEQDLTKLLKDSAKEEGAFAGDYNKGLTKHLFKMYFPKKLNNSVQFQYGDYLFSMRPENVQSINQQSQNNAVLTNANLGKLVENLGKVKDKGTKARDISEFAGSIANSSFSTLPGSNELVYSDVWYHTDLKYEINYNGISESVILNDLSAERKFSFFVQAKGFELRTTPNDEIGAYSLKDGQLLFFIPKPIMWDANHVYCNDVKYVLQEEKNGYRLTLQYDERFLTMGNRAFPVTIDPDIVLARNYVDEMSFIDTNNPNTNYYSSARMEVGGYKVWNWWAWDHWEKKRGIFRFNRLTADLGAVSDQVQVKSAKLYLTCSENTTASTYVDVYHVNYNATNWEVTRVTWNSPWGDGGWLETPSDEDTWVYVAKGESAPRTYVCYLNNDTVATWIHSNETLNKGLMLFDYYENTNTETLKKFNNAALELTLNEEIFIEAGAATYANTPQSVQFTCNASSATCGSISRYEWDFDINDGLNNADTRQNPVYCYQTPGEHPYSVKVTDVNGHSRTYYGSVTVNPVNIAAYYGVSDPKTLRFVTDTNFSNCTYNWNFGDGSSSYYGAEGYHKYNTEGDYNVQLTISNNYGVNPLVLTKTLKYYHPIILVHGFNDDTTRFTKLYEYLKPIVYAGDMNVRVCSAGDNVVGEPVHTIFNFDYYRMYASDSQFLNTGIIGTDGTTVRSTDSGNGITGDQYNNLTYKYSDLLHQMVEKVCAATGFDKVDLVAHSMGGLVCRSYIKYQGGSNRVDRLLTCGTPNHGIGDLQAFAAKITPSRDWMRELEVREMYYNSDSFYNAANPGVLKSYVEMLNNDNQINITGHDITGCGNDDTVGPTRYATVAGTDKGEVNYPVVDLIWEWLAPDDGIVDVGSVGLHGTNVDANFLYPGTHAMQVPGTKSSLQSVIESPFVASFINTWMHQDRTLNAVASKPAAWVDVQKYADGTVSKFVCHTGANKSNAIWTWAMLQHEEEVQDGNDLKMIYTFKDYNSFWQDLSNVTGNDEVVIDLSPAHYLPGDKLRITVITYDTQGVKVEYIPVQL